MRINKINREEYHEQHFLIHKELDNEFKKVISNYNSFGLDKTTKSELLRFLITEFISEFNNSDDVGKVDLLKRLKNFREKGAGAIILDEMTKTDLKQIKSELNNANKIEPNKVIKTALNGLNMGGGL